MYVIFAVTNVRQYVNDIFKSDFSYENWCILKKKSQQFVVKRPINKEHYCSDNEWPQDIIWTRVSWLPGA